MNRSDPLRLADYLGHMTQAIARILVYVEGITEPAFLEDRKTQDAVVRNFEILGEAARKVELHHAAFASAHPEVPWALMYTMRNRLAHGYFKVDYELVWQTIHADLPDLAAAIANLPPPGSVSD